MLTSTGVCVWAQWHSKTFTLASPCSPLSLSPTLRFGSQALLPQQPESAHTKEKVGLVPVWVTLVRGVDTHTNFQLVVSSSDLSAGNNESHLPSVLQASCFLLSCFALSLRACVPAGSDSSSSHLVLGKLGYANNISANNISTSSNSGEE